VSSDTEKSVENNADGRQINYTPTREASRPDGHDHHIRLPRSSLCGSSAHRGRDSKGWSGTMRHKPTFVRAAKAVTATVHSI